MGAWNVAFGCAAAVAGVAALYGLHRLALSLEQQGHLYYIHKSPKGSAAGCFVALQKAVEPQAQHVMVVREELQEKGESAGSDFECVSNHAVAEPRAMRRLDFPRAPVVRPRD